MTTIVENVPASADLFISAIGPGTEIVESIEQLRRHLEERPDEYAIVLGSGVDIHAATSLADTLRVLRPMISVILLRKRVDSSVLAEALRSGMRDVVEERDLTALSTAVRRAHSLHEALLAGEQGEGNEARGRLITVFSAKGGVGKTTVSTNIAVTLAQMDNKVCLVDLDLAFGDVAITLQLFPEHTIADAVAMQADLDAETLDGLLTKYSEDLCALVAPTTPLAKATITQELVGKILTSLKQRFDYVVVDTPPAFDDVVLQAFDASDLLLLVLTLDIPALKNIKVTLETLELLNFPREKCRIVLNRADAKVGLTVNEVEATLHSDIAASIASAREVPASVNRGEPIVIALPRHPVSQTFMTLARDCVAAIAAANVKSPGTAAEAAQSDGAGRRRRLLRRGSRHG
jgi:pilus assembly protein CpaE